MGWDPNTYFQGLSSVRESMFFHWVLEWISKFSERGRSFRLVLECFPNGVGFSLGVGVLSKRVGLFTWCRGQRDFQKVLRSMFPRRLVWGHAVKLALSVCCSRVPHQPSKMANRQLCLGTSAPLERWCLHLYHR